MSIVIFSYGNNCLLPGVNVNFLNESVWCGLSAAGSRVQHPACGGVPVHVRWPDVNHGCSTQAVVASLCTSGGLRETARGHRMFVRTSLFFNLFTVLLRQAFIFLKRDARVVK